MNTIITGFARQCVAASAVLLALTVVLGAGYPAAVWAVSRIDSHSAEGAQVVSRQCDLGSSMIGVDPQVPPGEPDPYLHARVVGATGEPMAPGDPAASAASNKGPGNEELREWITARRAVVAEREGVRPQQVPPDAVTASASGLDPDISPDYARLQIPRLARENGRSVAHIQEIIDRHTSGRQWGFLGQPRVNVPAVNLALGHAPAACRTPA
ncbi:potassium-transporting ATPase subunit C [Gordonia sp. CPCC 206044]|uniref:potassium-transporting ATPase subunit C n=1 Tax=Gordonia sp. CPCC 206044 TaxID=3140793 RepID=UPI003AF3AFB4